MKPLIVYVDDIKNNIETTISLLESEWRVVTFDDPVQALVGLQSMSPTVILSDQKMPSMSGIEFFTKAANICPLAVRVLITGYSAEEIVMKSINVAKVHEYIKKPCTDAIILETLTRALALYEKGYTEHLRHLKTEEEAKRAKEDLIQAEKMRALGVMSSGISHEILNQLAFVRNAAQALVSTEKIMNPENMEKLRVNIARGLDLIESGTSQAIEICKGLKAYSGDESKPFVPFELKRVIDSVTLILGEKIKRNQVAVNCQIADIMIHGNEASLHQVFMNLISNAIDAMGKGGRITITAAKVDAQAKIEVTDTGSGIPPEVLKKIFDPFFTTKAVGLGTGLGLSIVKGEIERHKGKLLVESKVGVGTKFTVLLPMN